MRKILFFTDSVKAAIMPRTKQAHALLVRRKKLSYGSAAILALLAAPFAVQAMAPAFNGGNQSVEAPPKQAEQPAPKVKSSVKGQGNHVEIESHSESSSSSNNNSDVDVTINGQKVPVPESGSIHKRMSGNGGETVVDIQVDNDSSSHSSSSSTTITVDNHSSSSGEDDDERSSIRRIPRR